MQYDSYLALNSVGMDSGISVLTLYGNWKTVITLNANGGTLTGGTTDEERALNGLSQGSLVVSVNQAFTTSLTATRSNYVLKGFNTQADGSGIWMSDYSRVTGPMTFYAVWYQASQSFSYTGNVQTYTVPVDGIYQISMTGATGAHGYYSGADGTVYAVYHGGAASTSGQISLSQGDVLYFYVGGHGRQGMQSVVPGGYNGGGNAYGSGSRAATSGGGATDVRINSTALTNRIMVAAGGGGSSQERGGYGGYGGALTGQQGGNGGGAGGTQSTGNALGTGGSGLAGGGGGYFGGRAGTNTNQGGGGGSSYISGYPGCPVSSTGYTFSNGSMTAGMAASNSSGAPNADGSATIRLIAFN